MTICVLECARVTSPSRDLYHRGPSGNAPRKILRVENEAAPFCRDATGEQWVRVALEETLGVRTGSLRFDAELAADGLVLEGRCKTVDVVVSGAPSDYAGVPRRPSRFLLRRVSKGFWPKTGTGCRIFANYFQPRTAFERV